MMEYDRLSSPEILDRLETRPALLLTGLRQSGKSTLLKALLPKARYVTFDDALAHEDARLAPQRFLRSFDGHQVILDEIQYVPGLFRELKIFIDQDRVPGRWVLTGSQKFALLEEARESLAGRLSIIELETMGAQELRPYFGQGVSALLYKGGFPELWANPKIRHRSFLNDYVTSYLEKDLRSILQTTRLLEFNRFLRLCAQRVGQLVNFSDLSRDVGISPNTAKEWVSTLVGAGMLVLLEPYFANINKRLTKAPKLYFCDQGLLCHFLGIYDEKTLNSHNLAGNIWENFVFNELMRTKHIVPGQNLFFYRDQNNVEVDFVIDIDGRVTLIEAKYAERPDAAKIAMKRVAKILPHGAVSEYIACIAPIERPSGYYGYDLWNPFVFDLPGL